MMHSRLPALRFAAAAVALLLPMLAAAHAGHDAVHDFATGFRHPLSGLDHVLAALAVGFWAAQLRGRAVTRLPLAFIALFGAAHGFVHVTGAWPAADASFVAGVITGNVLLLMAGVWIGARAMRSHRVHSS